MVLGLFFFQAEDGIRDLVRSRGLGDVYKRQPLTRALQDDDVDVRCEALKSLGKIKGERAVDLAPVSYTHLTLPTIYSV